MFVVASVVFNANAASTNATIEKVVRQYAITSANDFPQRDPADWRLLGSRDGGKTWITLDSRSGEIFSERHQRRIFELAKPMGFNLYRLQIDRVRDPSDAQAVQIAELELMGNSAEDLSPTPIFADLITAQGENPPLESVQEIFDGREETKWLDQTAKYTKTHGSWIQWQYLDQSGLVITHLQKLRMLPPASSESYPVRLEGTLVGLGCDSNAVSILEGMDFIEVSGITNIADFQPGQQVRLSGRSRWNGARMEIGEPVLTALSPKTSLPLKKIVPGESFPADEDFREVEAEGFVQFLTVSKDRVDFELTENEQTLLVHVLCPDFAFHAPAIGARVRVRGVGTGVFNESERVAGVLWVSSKDAVTLANLPKVTLQSRLNSGSRATNENASILTDIRQIRQLEPKELLRRPKIRVRGVLTELFSTYLQEGSAGIELINPIGAPLPAQNFGSYVEVEGIATWGMARGPTIVAQTIRVLGEGKLPEPERPSWNQLTGGQMNAKWIEISAVVRATDGSHLLLDYEGRQMMATIRSAASSKVKELVDASVTMRGVCVNATDDRGIVQGIQLIVPSLDYVMVKEPAPDPWTVAERPISSLNRIGSQTESSHRVKVTGTLTFQEGRKYFLQQNTNSGLMVVAKADVLLNELSPGSRWVFWQSTEENTSQSTERLALGDEVEAVGFIETHGFAPMLTEALVRKTGESSLIPPLKTTAADLAGGRYDSIVVSVEGLVLECETVGIHYVLQIQSGQRVFHATLRAKSRETFNIVPGSLVRLTGVCQMELAPYSELGKSQAAFSILLRNAADITLLQEPPWWTVGRALIVVGTLALVLLGAVVWIRMLHRRVEEKTSELRQEIADHEKTEGRLAEETKLLHLEIGQHKRTEARLAEKTNSLEKEIEERKRVQAEVERIHKQLLSASRLAGMADVATNVLHNVGNVLNSVNVLASSIAAHVQKSKLPGVARLAALLAQHQPDVGRFLAEDENGKHVPGHLERLGAHLLEEQTRLQEKTKLLTESIQHIKEIVAMQQNYAKVAGIWETLPITEIVEDALRMCNDALMRHKIEVVRDYGGFLPPVAVDRHKVLQIMFNLLDNAKCACELNGNIAGRIIIRIRPHGQGRIRVQVIDNGIGIPKENLSRIFTQGFSTRKDGHGFGLHGSILAAQDMGGSLVAESEGTGAGAVFTLELSESVEVSAKSASSHSKAVLTNQEK